MKQLVIPALKLEATPDRLFAKRMKVEAKALKESSSEIFAIRKGREWLNKQK